MTALTPAERGPLYRAGAAARDAEWAAKITALADDPDDTQWWEVVPYMDPPEQDEAVEVQVVATDRLRALVEQMGGKP